MDILQAVLPTYLRGHVLDVATGRGEFLQTAVENVPRLRLALGVDSSRRFMPVWRNSLGQGGMLFACMDAAFLAVPAACLDGVCISNSLHHIADLSAVFREVTRVLTPGGFVVVNEMISDGQSETQQTHVRLHHWWAAIDRLSGIEHQPTLTRGALLDRLRGLGLREAWVGEYASPGDDPHDAQTTQSLVALCQSYPEKIKGRPEYPTICEQGAVLIERVRQVGFTSATEVVWIGQKV